MHDQCAHCYKLRLRWQLIRDQETDLQYCPGCWGFRYQGQKIPEGRECHFQFYRWLYCKARLLTEWPDDLVVLREGEELPTHVVAMPELQG